MSLSLLIPTVIRVYTCCHAKTEWLTIEIRHKSRNRYQSINKPLLDSITSLTSHLTTYHIIKCPYNKSHTPWPTIHSHGQRRMLHQKDGLQPVEMARRTQHGMKLLLELVERLNYTRPRLDSTSRLNYHFQVLVCPVLID